ncbi:L-xylulose reductase-like [Tetranychus urticae]|uniref:L-xylulose reductase-like n=1 Tax=Tetranychus urticae TaxID=32264 RepID=UPI000D645995|nr:L-xylulose reductase-like [Tetranychus urticae]
MRRFYSYLAVYKADYIRDEDVVRTFEETISVYKTLDILVNNCGLAATGRFGEPDDMADYARANAAPYLKETNGAIVNVSSVAGIRPLQAYWSYCMSKASLDMFTKCMAGKLAFHVRVNSVKPGLTRSNFFSSHPDPDALLSALAQEQPLKRIAETIDIANVIAFLASDAAKNMTGSIVVSDTGELNADPLAK